MKTNSIKTNGLKGIFTKVVLAGSIAAAVFMAAPQKAEAQVAVGIHFGRPAYVAPVYGPSYAYGYGYGYDARFRHDEWARREAWGRHERFERDRHFDRGYRR